MNEEIISKVRGEKTNNNASLKTPVKMLDISLSDELNDAINKSIKDFKATLFIENMTTSSIEEGYHVNKVELEIIDWHIYISLLYYKARRLAFMKKFKIVYDKTKKRTYSAVDRDLDVW